MDHQRPPTARRPRQQQNSAADQLLSGGEVVEQQQQQQQTRPDTRAAAHLRRPKTAGRNFERPPTTTQSSVPIAPPTAAASRPRTRIGSTIGHQQEMSGGGIGIGAGAVDGAQRPGTRAGNSFGTAVDTYGGGGGGYGMPPRSAAGSRAGVVSRSAIRSSTSMARPGTMARAGGGGPMASVAAIQQLQQQQRPITQQGLGGARQQTAMSRRRMMISGAVASGAGAAGMQQPPPRSRMGSRMGTMGGGGGRQVADKSYYIALLNNQLNALDAECTSLAAELEKAQQGRANLLAYEQRAEQQAQELKQLQGQLADYNMIIDRQYTNANLRSLEFEVEQAEATNQALTTEVDGLFRERQLREEQVAELEERLQRFRAQNAQQVDAMEREFKEEYAQVQAEAETLRADVERKQAELDELTKTKEQLEVSLASSPLKQQAMLLEEQLAELRHKRDGLRAELDSKETPETRREHYVQQIQRDNQEIALMQEQLQEMNEQMVQAQEELQEFQNEFELLAGDKSDRFRELKNREAHMNTFLDTFEQSKAETNARIDALSQQIVRQLQLMSLNCRHAEMAPNVTALDESMLALGNAGVSAGELQELHVRLQVELITLDQKEALLRTEFDSLRAKQTQIDEEMAQMVNKETKRAELAAKSRELVANQHGLENELERVEAETARLKAQNAEERGRMGDSPQLARLSELKTQVDTLETERGGMEEKLKELQAKYDYQPLKQRVLEMRAEYNELLVGTALGGGGSASKQPQQQQQKNGGIGTSNNSSVMR